MVVVKPSQGTMPGEWSDLRGRLLSFSSLMTAGCPGSVPEEKPRYLIKAASGNATTGA